MICRVRDGLCGVLAGEQVRRCGGVLDLPAGSVLWRYAALPAPGLFADSFGGRTFDVYQGAYGHPCPKPTWLYVVGCDDVGFRGGTGGASGRVESQWSSVRHITPPAFADELVSVARRCCLTDPWEPATSAEGGVA